MPTHSGTVEVTWTRQAGPPPTVVVSQVRIIDSRIGGSGILDLDPPPSEWLSTFALLAGKRATVTYEAGPPLVISQVKAG